jgi:S-DNA-T family DNA segregation ATPase FtsK/SpoIIIE
LNELVGFVGVTVAALLALSLLSYSPRDSSFNVAGPVIAGHPARNWIGPVGAHIADLAFQLCGYAAFLFPIAFLLLALAWFRSRPI